MEEILFLERFPRARFDFNSVVILFFDLIFRFCFIAMMARHELVKCTLYAISLLQNVFFFYVIVLVNSNNKLT